MAQEQREQIEVIRGNGIEQRERVIEAAPSTRRVFVSRFSQFLWLMATIAILVLGMRFVFVLIDANPNTEFVNLIYQATNGLVAPFQGIVNTPGLDVAAIIAMVVILVVFWLVISLFQILFADTRRVRKVTRVNVER